MIKRTIETATNTLPSAAALPRRARRPAAPSLLAALLCLGAPAAVHALPQGTPDQAPAGEERTIEVRVLEIAGGRAYITPGEGAGLRVGQDVIIDGRRYRVVAVESDHAVIDIGDRRLREGERGRAKVSVRSVSGSPLAPPVPLSEFDGQWTAPVRPAERQNPQRVPLGAGGGSGRYRLALLAGAASMLPFVDEAEPITYASLGARLHAEPWQETPFSFDADAAVALWLGEDLDQDQSTGTAALGARSRPLVRVRELAAHYGDAGSPLMAGLGRLRYAASTVGLLDGVRLASPSFGNLRVAAFGGVVPDTLDGVPEFEHRRFGLEAVYHAARSEWQPFVSVVAHGSQFEGELDERRLSSYVSTFRGPMAMTAYAELSMFDEDNPWGAEQLELTAAGIDASIRTGGARNTRYGLRLDMRTPERSYWLQSLLPAGWLCTAVPQGPGAPLPEPCNGFRDVRYAAAADARIDLGRLALSGGATVISVSSGEPIEAVTLFADARMLELLGRYRGSLGVYATHAAFIDSVTLQASAGGPMLMDGLDLSLFYRPALLRYSASVEDILDHRYGVDMVYTPRPRLDVALTLEGMTSADVLAVGAFATAVWRLQL
ncbi:MAG TPA: hypothetical protein VNM90_10065 [Haliangium sp.]|nr:hypothetical protein [Haliangium sp.]